MNKREDWWEYTKRIIRSYPALRRKAESVGDMPCTPAYGASGGHSGGGSPVERAVVDRLIKNSGGMTRCGLLSRKPKR